MLSIVVESLSDLTYVKSVREPMDCSPPGSSYHGISQARMLQWIPFPSPGDLSDQSRVSCIAGGFFIAEPPGKKLFVLIVDGEYVSNVIFQVCQLLSSIDCRTLDKFILSHIPHL